MLRKSLVRRPYPAALLESAVQVETPSDTARRRCAILLALPLVITLNATSQARAETSTSAEADAIGEVLVTAERRSESILQVPVAVSALTGDDFAARHVTHLADLSAHLPNVEISAPRGSSLTDVVIRGVGVANDFSINQASPVGIYLDDSYMASRTFSSAQAFDLDRIEVLRGPQGTLFGRNTTGGLINFITRAPRLEGDDGRVELGYGNFNDVRAEGAYERTIVPDTLGVRIAGVFHRHDGYYDNINPGQPDADDLDTAAARIEVRAKPNDNLDITLKAYGQHDDNRQWNSRMKLVGAATETPDDPFEVNNTTGHFNSSSSGVQLKIVAELPRSVTLTHLSSFDRGHLRLDAIDLDGRPGGPDSAGFTQQFQTTEFRQVNEELRLNYDGRVLKVVVGAYYGQDVVRDNERYDLVTVLPVSPRFRYEQERKSKAVFAQLDYAATKALTLTGGVRFTDDSNTYRDGHADVAIPVVPGGIINTLPGAGSPNCPGLVCPTAVQPTQRGSDEAVTGRLAAKYGFSGGQIAYASYSRGYRAGAFNGIAYLSPAQLFYVNPETVDAYEVGAKGRFLGGRARASVAMFYNDYRNQQVNFIRSVVTALGPFPVNILDNVPKATTKGIELDGVFAVSERFIISGAVGFLEAKYAEGTVVAGQSLSKNRLPYAPRVSGSVGFNWTVGEVLGGAVQIAPTLAYSSRYFFDPTSNPDVAMPGFTRMNATLSWAADPYVVRLWANNLTNEKHNTYGIDLSANTGNFSYVGAPPRTFGLSVARNF